MGPKCLFGDHENLPNMVHISCLHLQWIQALHSESLCLFSC